MPITPSTPLSKVLNSRLAGSFRRTRGIETVGDLLDFWPRRYRTGEADLGNLREKQYLVSVAEVVRVEARRMSNRPGRMFIATLSDGRHEIDATFFKAAGHEHKLVPGARAIFAGTVTLRTFRGQQRWQLAHPGYTMLDEYDPGATRRLIPVYLQVGTLHTWTVSQCVRQIIDAIEELPDPLPSGILVRRDLLTRIEALRAIHAPTTLEQTQAGKHRMAYEEALVLQLVLAQRRERHGRDRTRARMPRTGGLLDNFDDRLPFELTAGQREVGATIARELGAPTPMHRLLQGEVGSGKTVIALRAMLTVVDAGGQAALLAPTEVLAAQHHRSITAMLGDLAEAGMLGGAEQATRVALLTGSQPTAVRRRQLLDIASGRAGIVIGTHALIQDAVSFADLALVVVDEQHRFGVEQRDQLRAKGEAPHVLVMTATPIPRTVAMTVFGDMATSTLRELPVGRAPITSHVVPEWKPWFGRTWERVAEEVRLGRQCYVVCPRIGGEGEDADDLDGADIITTGSSSAEDLDDGVELAENEPPPGAVESASGAAEPSVGEAGTLAGVAGPSAGEAGPSAGVAGSSAGVAGSSTGVAGSSTGEADRPMHGVIEMLAQLQQTPALTGLRLAALHGRMPSDEKDATMSSFAAGRIDVLVATTVIEVGVDVPNASVMVILDADRFGISQLHQLRGRVGRGGLPGLCLLVSGTQSEEVGGRLESVASTNDGFELARLDLAQRREGDILGAAQHGHRSQLRFLHVLEDEELIEAARADAVDLVSADPELAAHDGLREAVAEWVEAEQAAWLERG